MQTPVEFGALPFLRLPSSPKESHEEEIQLLLNGQATPCCSLPELRPVYPDGHRVLDAVGVLQGELKELGRAQRGVDGVVGGDGLAEHGGDALGLDALSVRLDQLEVSGVLNPVLVAPLGGGGNKDGLKEQWGGWSSG